MAAVICLQRWYRQKRRVARGGGIHWRKLSWWSSGDRDFNVENPATMDWKNTRLGFKTFKTDEFHIGDLVDRVCHSTMDLRSKGKSLTKQVAVNDCAIKDISGRVSLVRLVGLWLMC